MGLYFRGGAIPILRFRFESGGLWEYSFGLAPYFRGVAAPILEFVACTDLGRPSNFPFHLALIGHN